MSSSLLDQDIIENLSANGPQDQVDLANCMKTTQLWRFAEVSERRGVPSNRFLPRTLFSWKFLTRINELMIELFMGFDYTVLTPVQCPLPASLGAIECRGRPQAIDVRHSSLICQHVAPRRGRAYFDPQFWILVDRELCEAEVYVSLPGIRSPSRSTGDG